MMKFVEKLVAIRPYKLTLRFNTGEVRAVHLEATLRLLDPEPFSRARLDPESRTTCWDGLAREINADGTERAAPLDLCPEVLYELSAPVAQDDIGLSGGPGAQARGTSRLYPQRRAPAKGLTGDSTYETESDS